MVRKPIGLLQYVVSGVLAISVIKNRRKQSERKEKDA